MSGEFDASWPAVQRDLLIVVSAAQLGAARNGAGYVPAVLAETGQPDGAVGEVDPRAFVGVASDGRELGPLLYGAVTTAKDAARGTITTDGGVTTYFPGVGAQEALARGGRWLDMAVWTQVADAARGATHVGIVARPQIGGYVRMLNPPSCSRCVVLTGKWYRFNQGFRRHNRCDCVHIPVSENRAGDFRTDPKAYFESLSKTDQDRIFTNAGAESIRLGADIGQVVNARRGARGLTPAGARVTAEEARILRGGLERGHLQTVDVFGRQVFTTTEGTTRRGVASVRLGAWEDGVKVPGARYRSSRTPRLMPESLLELSAGNRDEAVRLLRHFGYIL
jgi:hypothetical protein